MKIVSLINLFTIIKPKLQKKGIVALQTFRHFTLATLLLVLFCNSYVHSQELPVNNETIIPLKKGDDSTSLKRSFHKKRIENSGTRYCKNGHYQI